MILSPFQKLTIIQLNERQNFQVVGITEFKDDSKLYLLASRLKDFGISKRGSRLIKINSIEIEKGNVKIEIH